MRYGISILVVAFLIIIGSVVLIGRGNNGSKTTTNARITKLADYANNDTASVSWTMQGGLVGEDQYKAVRVTVTKSKRTAEVLGGYGQRVEKSVEFANSPESFATFTRALDNLGFGRERAVALADERGVCPQGNRFIYRVTDGTKEIMRTWSSSCSTKEGPFGGKTPTVIRELFRQQITDYSKFVSGVKL
jgi:hypothetical protein